jgi:hypothetical protein
MILKFKKEALTYQIHLRYASQSVNVNLLTVRHLT